MSEVRTLTIDEQTAKQLYELYRNCESADAYLHQCQNGLFRQQIKSCYTAQNVQRAFEIVGSFLERREDHE